MKHCTGSANLQSLSTNLQVFSEVVKFCIRGSVSLVSNTKQRHEWNCRMK